MWNNLVIQHETSWNVGYCQVLFPVSSVHLTTHLAEDESGCEPGLIFHYCCTRDFCVYVCVCLQIHQCSMVASTVLHVCLIASANAFAHLCKCVCLCVFHAHLCIILKSHCHFIRSKVAVLFLRIPGKYALQTCLSATVQNKQQTTWTVIFSSCSIQWLPVKVSRSLHFFQICPLLFWGIHSQEHSWLHHYEMEVLEPKDSQ